MYVGLCTPLQTSFIYDFALVIKIISFKIFHFSEEWKVISVALQKGGVPLPQKSWGVFQTYWPRQVGSTLCMDLKLGMYNHLEPLESLKMFWGISNIFEVFMTSSMSDFYITFQFLATARVIKCVDVLIGSTNLPSSMCNRPCVVDLSCHNSRKRAISSTRYIKWQTFSSTCSTPTIIKKFYYQVSSVKRSKLTKFGDDIISKSPGKLYKEK